MIGTPLCLGYRDCISMVVVGNFIQIGVATLHKPPGSSLVYSTVDIIAVIVNM